MHFTDSQWKAAFEVERFTDMDPSYFGYIRDFKRALGGQFARANFATGVVMVGRPECAGRLDYHVVELDSKLIFGHAHDTRAEALAEARALVLEMGSSLLAMLLADRCQRHAPPASREMRPRKVGRRARAVFEASGGQCHYCGTALQLEGRWHIEHKFPRALFGGSEQSNLVAACVPCNAAKRDKTDLEFIESRMVTTRG